MSSTRSKILRGAAGLAAAGAIHALTFAPGPLPVWCLALVQVLALAVLARASLYAPGIRQAWLRGWLFSFVSFSIGLYWLFISMHHYGGLPPALAVAGVLALSAFLAVFPAFACALTRWFTPLEVNTPAGRVLLATLTWGAAWGALEWLRAVVLTGFPWLNIGYAQVDSPIAGWAPIVGVHGMAFLAAFTAAALASLWQPERKQSKDARRALAAAVAITLVILGWPLSKIEWSSPTGEALNIRLVQGNVEQSQKFDPAVMEQALIQHMNLTSLPPAAGTPAPELIILPETVIPIFQDTVDPQVWEVWRRIATERGATIVMGTPIHDQAKGQDRYTNSVIGFNGDTPLAQIRAGTTAMRYDKHHLVPWGEYVPPGFRWFVDMLNIPLGDFDRGHARQAPFLVGTQHIAFNICYEDLFGSELLAALEPGADGSQGATMLANVSNLGWFGDSWALRQHLQIARLRTIETARPMVTATNTGITAAIDAQGRVAAQLPTHQTGILPVSVQGMTGLTPYARFGDKAALALMGLVLIAAAGAAHRNRRAK